jgi:tetratricopeptide (TPR) repeat protein
MIRTIFTGMAAIAMSAATIMAQSQAPQAPQAPKVSKGEADAYNAMINAARSGDNDGVIKAADDLTTKYADTQFKATALMLEAQAYVAKGDLDRAQVYAEQCMAADPKGFQAPLLIGESIVKQTRENDLDKDEKLAKAEKDLNLSIENVKAAPKPNPQIPDAQWEDQKKFTVAEAQADLGRVNMLRKKYADAVGPLQAAADADPQPAYFVWLAMSQQQSGKNDDAIATCDKLLAQPNLPQVFQDAGKSVKAAATRAKGAK